MQRRATSPGSLAWAALNAGATAVLLACGENGTKAPSADLLTPAQFRDAFESELSRRTNLVCASEHVTWNPKSLVLWDYQHYFDPGWWDGYDPAAARDCLAWLRSEPEGVRMEYAVSGVAWRDRFPQGNACLRVFPGSVSLGGKCSGDDLCLYQPGVAEPTRCASNKTCQASGLATTRSFPGGGCIDAKGCVSYAECVAGICKSTLEETYIVTCHPGGGGVSPCAQTAKLGEECHYSKDAAGALYCAPPNVCPLPYGLPYGYGGSPNSLKCEAPRENGEACEAHRDCASLTCVAPSPTTAPGQGRCRPADCRAYYVLEPTGGI